MSEESKVKISKFDKLGRVNVGKLLKRLTGRYLIKLNLGLKERDRQFKFVSSFS